MTKYEPTIGLEIHVTLDTKVKMFCSCPNNFDERHPNINVCPICLGHPGNLPVINKRAVESVIKLGFALGGKIASQSHFDRKSYFYPDLPKGYQITQYEKPLVEGGELVGVNITRIHLEEDAGRLLHSEDGKSSLVDLNRAGTPLMELVTEPDIKTADEAVRFAREFQIILRYLGISRADIEKGQMRVEANISLNKGTKIEVKNIGSFRAVRDAIKYEIERQTKLLDSGKDMVQETRGWDENEKITKLQRVKESAHDYRYFPEPDLPPLNLDEFDLEKFKSDLPELPKDKRARFNKEFGIEGELLELLIEDRNGAEYFEEITSEAERQLQLKKESEKPDIQTLLLNYFLSDLRGLMNEKRATFEDLKIRPEHFACLIAMIARGELSSKMAKELLLKMFETGEGPETLKRESNFELISDEKNLKSIAEEVINNNPQAVQDFKDGKENALQFLVGQMMAKTRGQAEPEKAADILKQLLA